MDKIETSINAKLLVCADESLKEILAEFINALQQESRIRIVGLNLQIEVAKNYYVSETNVDC